MGQREFSIGIGLHVENVIPPLIVKDAGAIRRFAFIGAAAETATAAATAAAPETGGGVGAESKRICSSPRPKAAASEPRAKPFVSDDMVLVRPAKEFVSRRDQSRRARNRHDPPTPRPAGFAGWPRMM